MKRRRILALSFVLVPVMLAPVYARADGRIAMGGQESYKEAPSSSGSDGYGSGSGTGSSPEADRPEHSSDSYGGGGSGSGSSTGSGGGGSGSGGSSGGSGSGSGGSGDDGSKSQQSDADHSPNVENDGDADDDQYKARRAVQNRKAVPLVVVLDQFQNRFKGQVVDVRLIRPLFQLQYRLTYIDETGSVRRAYFDAKTGAFIR